MIEIHQLKDGHCEWKKQTQLYVAYKKIISQRKAFWKEYR